MDGVPVENADDFRVGRTLQAEQRHLRVRVGGVQVALSLRVGEVRPETAVDVAVLHIRRPDIDVPLLERLVGPLDRQHRAVDNSLEALFVESEGRDLGENIVVPASRPRVRMRADKSHVGGVVHAILFTQVGEAVENPVADSSVAAHRVDDNVHEPVGRFVNIPDDERPGVQALAEPSALLLENSVAMERDLDGGTRDIALTRAEEVLVPRGGYHEREAGEQKNNLMKGSHGGWASLLGSTPPALV